MSDIYYISPTNISWSQHKFVNTILSNNNIILQPGYIMPIYISYSGSNITNQLITLQITNSSLLFSLSNNTPSQISIYDNYMNPLPFNIISWTSPSATINTVVNTLTNEQIINIEINPSLQSDYNQTLNYTSQPSTSISYIDNLSLLGYQPNGSITTPIIDQLRSNTVISLSLGGTITYSANIDKLNIIGSNIAPSTSTIDSFTDSNGLIHNYWQPDSFGTTAYSSITIYNNNLLTQSVNIVIPYRYYEIRIDLTADMKPYYHIYDIITQLYNSPSVNILSLQSNNINNMLLYNTKSFLQMYSNIPNILQSVVSNSQQYNNIFTSSPIISDIIMAISEFSNVINNFPYNSPYILYPANIIYPSEKIYPGGVS